MLIEESNPPNVPQAQTIENIWGNLAQKVYEGGWQASTEGGWQASTEQVLIDRIKLKLKEIEFFTAAYERCQSKIEIYYK